MPIYDGTYIRTRSKEEVAYKNSIPFMKAVKALQEAQTRIETLESDVQALKDA